MEPVERILLTSIHFVISKSLYLIRPKDASLTPGAIPTPIHVLRSLESLGKPAHVLFKATVIGKELNVSTVDLDTACSLALEVIITTEGGETPVLGDDNLLAAGELVLGPTESLEGQRTVLKNISIFSLARTTSM